MNDLREPQAKTGTTRKKRELKERRAEAGAAILLCMDAMRVKRIPNNADVTSVVLAAWNKNNIRSAVKRLLAEGSKPYEHWRVYSDGWRWYIELDYLPG